MNRCKYLLFSSLFIMATLGISSADDADDIIKGSVKMPSGDLMPLVGFGTASIVGDDNVLKILDLALAAGYRLFDSAIVYRNEESIGKALRALLPKYNLTREDVFLTSKLPLDGNGPGALASITQSLRRFDTKYLDLYLIHSPNWRGRDPTKPAKNDSVLRDEAWREMINAYQRGLVRNIGVSNYNTAHLTELLNNDHGVKPAVNQVQWHPKYHQDDLLELCRKEGILLQAYFSFGGSHRADYLLDDPIVKEIAAKLKKTPAQVLLRWSLQQRIAIIPRASSKDHMDENLQLDFTIPEEDMRRLSSLNH